MVGQGIRGGTIAELPIIPLQAEASQLVTFNILP